MGNLLLIYVVNIIHFIHFRTGHRLDGYCQMNISKTTIVETENEGNQNTYPVFENSYSENSFDRTSSQSTYGGPSKLYMDTDTNADLVIKQIKIFELFKMSEPRPVQKLYSCFVEVNASPLKPGQIILNFETFNEVKSIMFMSRFYHDSFLVLRVRAYLSALRALHLLHSQDIVHCNLTPSTVGSSDSKFCSMIFKDLIYAQDLSQEPLNRCPQLEGVAFAKDIHQINCQSKDNVKKADVWSLALIILQIEMKSNLLKNMFLFDNKYVMANECYTKEWNSRCDEVLSTLIRKTFKRAREMNKWNTRNESLFFGLEKILLKMVDYCDQRPSVDELMNEFGDLLQIKESTEHNSINHQRKKNKPRHNNTGLFSAIWSCCTVRDDPHDEEFPERNFLI